MNFIKRFGLFLMIGVFAVACKKTDNPGAPTVSAIADKTTAAPGDVVKININASSDAARSLKKLRIDEISSGTSVPGNLLDSAISTGNIGFTYNYVVPNGATGTKTIRVTATDNNSVATSDDVVITISGSSADLNSYTMVMLPAPTADKASKSFFSTQNGNTYSYNDVVNTSSSVSPLIDFGYYYTSKAILAAPSNAGWTTDIKYAMSTWSKLNNTKFKTTSLTQADFNAANSSAIDAAASGASATSISSVSKGQVIAFTTEGNKNGLIYVEDLKPGVNTGDYIKIDVKVQK
jgi:hypothetical protein